MIFEVIPAIDLRGGRCVRLFQGDYDRETAYSDDPVAVACRWESLGAPRLHVVDLDGAREGRPVNHAVMAAICAAVSIPVEVSGGIRDQDAIAASFAYGAAQVQLGSAAVRNPELVREAIARHGEAISIAIDARNGRAQTDGWRSDGGVDALDLARSMAGAGAGRIMFTDIGRDATLTEPNFEALAEMVAAVTVPVIASGGVAQVEHLVRLAAMGCAGAIVGKALYEGTIDLPDALAAVQEVHA